MKTVFLTGAIGSGKSSVAALLSRRGIPVYDSDERTKSLYKRRPGLVRAVEKSLGVSLRGEDGELDKKRLAGIVFSDPSALEKLEAIVHPAVLEDFRRWRIRQEGKAPFVVMESAIVLSKPVFSAEADAVVWVEAPEDIRLKRVMERSGLSEVQVRERMSSQESELSWKADVIIINDSSPEALSARVDEVFFDKNSYICKLLNTE